MPERQAKITSGYQTLSRYVIHEVKAMIERQKEEYGWEFLFIGANIDAAETAANIGISRDRAANYHADSKGTEILYVTVSETISDVCASRPIQAEWAAPIHKDYQERK